MEQLDIIKNIKIQQEQVIEKQQEYKFVGSGRTKKGQFLFGLDNEKQEVYLVPILKKEAYDITIKKESASLKATINPEHFFVHAINIKNAIRKFKKLNLIIKNHEIQI